jgi:hypothetical protein
VPHAYRVTSPHRARRLIITPDGTFERFVRGRSRPAESPELPQPAGPPTPREQAAALAAAAPARIDLTDPPLDV